MYGAPKTVCAIVNGWNRHTNLPFSILTGGIRQWHNAWYHGGFHVFIKLHKEVNAEAFQKNWNKRNSKQTARAACRI